MTIECRRHCRHYRHSPLPLAGQQNRAGLLQPGKWWLSRVPMIDWPRWPRCRNSICAPPFWAPKLATGVPLLASNTLKFHATRACRSKVDPKSAQCRPKVSPNSSGSRRRPASCRRVPVNVSKMSSVAILLAGRAKSQPATYIEPEIVNSQRGG